MGEPTVPPYPLPSFFIYSSKYGIYTGEDFVNLLNGTFYFYKGLNRRRIEMGQSPINSSRFGTDF